MENMKEHGRVCPTRIDGENSLFAHKLSVAECNDRQRGRYHKCYTCVHNHAYALEHASGEARKEKAGMRAV